MKIKIFILFISIIVLLLVWISGSFVSKVKGRVVDENGNGIAGAYVVYGYEGTVNKLVDSDVYHRPGTIIRTDETGYFEIPGMISFHVPLMKGDLSLVVYAVYDPQTHCAGLLPYTRWYRATGLESYKKEQWWYDFKPEGDLKTLAFQNITSDPIAWYSSIRLLNTVFAEYGWNAWEAPAEDKRELLNLLLREYKEFQHRYGQEECLYREFFVKSQFPVSRQEFEAMQWHSKTYEEYKDAADSFYKGKTWNQVISYTKQELDDNTERLFDRPDYWYRKCPTIGIENE